MSSTENKKNNLTPAAAKLFISRQNFNIIVRNKKISAGVYKTMFSRQDFDIIERNKKISSGRVQNNVFAAKF